MKVPTAAEFNNAWAYLDPIVTAINTLEESDLNVLRAVVGLQVVNEDGAGDMSADHINRLGEYNLKILRALEQIRTARDEFNTYLHGAKKECINYL